MNQKIGLLIFDFFLLFSILGFSQETPYWVSSRPINKDYYIGIGRCKLNVNNYEDIAKRKALDDLVSEISTTVKSDKLLTENEKYDNVKTDFTSTIQLSSDLEIEGYELLETWKDNEHYWVYYQLSKEKYITIVESKIKIDYSLAESLYNTSLKNLKDGNISFSIKQMYQSLEALKKNFSRQVDSEFKQKSFVLKDLICEQLVNIYHRLRIETNDTIETIYPITTPLVINCQILYFDANNQAQAVANIPLIFYFENGQGVLSDSVLLSNDSGFSKINLISLTGFLDSYTIVTEIELSQLFNDCYKEYSFENLKKQIIVKPIKSKAFIRSNEYNLGQSISPKILLPLLSNYLIENGIEITENIDNANYLININSDTRRGSQTNGICTSFLQISIELKNKSGTIIYSDSKNNLKGLKLNYFDAGMNAYERNLNKIKEDVLNKLIMVINNYKE